MNKVIQCPCGFSIRGPDNDSVVRQAQEHAQSAHSLELSREHALAMAVPERRVRRASSDKGT